MKKKLGMYSLKFCGFVFIFLIGIAQIDAQSPKLDSLSDVLLQYNGQDSLYKQVCLKMAYKLRLAKKYEQSVQFVNQLLEREALQKDSKHYGQLNASLGSAYFRLKQDSLCFAAYSKAIDGFRTIKDTVSLIKMYANAATINSSLGNFRTALDSLKVAEPLIYKCKEAMKVSGVFFMGALKTTYSRLKDDRAALYYSFKMLDLCEYGTRTWRHSMINVAKNYSYLKNDSADIYIEQLIAFDELPKYPSNYKEIHELKISRLVNQGKVEQAEQLLLSLSDYAKQKKDPIDDDVFYQKMAMIHKKKKDYFSAMNYYKKAYQEYAKEVSIDLDYTNGLVIGYLRSKFAHEKDSLANHLLTVLNDNNKKLREKVVVISYLAFQLKKRNQKQGQLNEAITIQRDQVKLLNRELNHRVKNNLAFMTSLLEMEGRRTKNNETKQVLQESESRLKALALVHTNLFQDQTHTKVNLKNYLIEIINHLQDIFEIPDKKLHVETYLADIDIDAEDAMRIGLIVNELMTNSVKHAFSNVHSPKILVEIQQEASGKVSLRYKDNGPGIIQKPLQIPTTPSRSVGLKLIQLLQKQLATKLDLQLSTL